MDYDKAEKIRKKSFGSLLGEQEGGLGSSLKSAISLKTKAKITGIKEKFDPMNIARVVGGKSGAAIYGKVFGRNQESMERFAGAKKKRTLSPGGSDVSGESSEADVLGLIYRLMLRADTDKKLQDELAKNQKEEQDREDDARNEQIIRAITGRKKPKEKKVEKPVAKKEAPKVEVKAKPKAEAKPKVEKAPVREVPKQEAPKPTTKQAPKPAVKEVKKPSLEKVKPPVITGGDKGIMDMIKSHEGVRTKPYKDSLGLWTVGVGHLIGDGKTLPKEWDRELSMKEVDELFAKDYEHHKAMAMKTPGWDKANESGQAAMIDLAFNMGGSWYKKWPNTAKALEAGNFDKAADGLKDSKWYDQVKGRAVKIVGMIRQGAKTNTSGMIPTSQALPESLPSVGAKIDSASKENKELKRVSTKDTPAAIINSTTNVKQGATKTPKSPTGDDKNAYMRKAQE